MAQLIGKAKNFVAEKVAHIKKPEANLTDVSVKKVSKDSATFNGQVSVSNPYSHDLPICEITYSLKSADRVIASGTMMDPGSIKAKETTALDIPLKVPYDFLLSLAKDVGKDWDIDYEFQVGLCMQIPVIGKFTLPLSKKGEMKLPTIADVF
ncbi:late embryogenesis abundant protein Lea14-A [Magnolia sinica]|uniref:late embryogenesis abundant protein Lea14-A n=1 Tax=Magnolia sinica TaxID=86752 RepID=UPI00265900B0|nr:late embryogenesis abundant protein Lea14-A [Magnolia sinica]